MGKRDQLIYSAHLALKTSGGSFKARFNHLREVLRFVKTLRELGFYVQKWSNLTNKHVRVVVDHWSKEEKLATATLKEYLSGVRRVARHFGNDRIAPDNRAFGIENRVYVSNQDKSMPRPIYERVVAELKASGNPNHHRIAAQLMLQRHLGLRKEESFKFNPHRAVLKDGRVYVSDGTKGGRERMIQTITDQGRKAITYAQSIAPKGNTMPRGPTERQWSGLFYRTLKNHGITKDQSGASAHGLRHAYAQQRYEQLTGFAPLVKFASATEFQSHAEQTAGADWRKPDRDARLIIKSELGHGPDRDDVVSQYLGSVHK